MPTLLRMPDELYTQELAQVVAPQYALRTFQDALNGRPFHEPGFRSQVLEFLVRNYRAPAHLLDDAFNSLLEDLKVARVLMLERMPMMRAYHWQPGSGEEKGRWVVPTYIFAEHRNMLQLALDNAKSDVPSAGIHEAQEKPTPKVPYRKAASPAPAALKPGEDLVDRMAKHTSGEVPLSPEESIKLRKDLGKMNETLSPGEQFMVADYSPEEQAYIDEKNQKFSNDIGMVYSPAAAALGLPTRAITGDESKVAGAVNTGLAIEGAAGISAIGAKGKSNVKPSNSAPKIEVTAGGTTKPGISPSRSVPTGKVGSSPTGVKATVDGTADQKRSYQRENESAEILSKAGYNVEQNPAPPQKRPPGSDKVDLPKPDLKLEGNYADVYSPKDTTGEKKVFKEIYDKSKDQASRIVLNLSDSQMTSKDIAKAIESGKYGSRLKYTEELIVIDADSSIHHLYP